MKKIGFLGPGAWVVNSLLFGLYHIWQAPMTWPLIAFHFLVNIIWSMILGAVT